MHWDILKGLFRYVNTRLGNKVGIPALKDDTGTLVTCDLQRAEMFRNHFVSVFIKSSARLSTTSNANANSVAPFSTSELDVYYRLLALKDNKFNTSPEEIPEMFFKKCALFLAKPLSMIFNQSLASGKVPSIWKTSILAPLFKKGIKPDSVIIGLSLTCIPCKILEKIVKDKIYKHLTDNDLLSTHQHGFRPGRSTVVQLLICCNDWVRALNGRSSVDVIYIDFAKAFDSVDIGILLAKLERVGISGNLLNWCEDFLCGRTCRVKVENARSCPAQITSGVPQGSVLGPLFFLVFVDDLIRSMPDGVHCEMYADDLKLYFVNSDGFNVTG